VQPPMPPMPYGTVHHQHQHAHQQYSYGYAVVQPIIMSPPVVMPGMYAGAGPPHQIGYAVPSDYNDNSQYHYGAVPAAAPPTASPPQQVFVRSNQPSFNEEGVAATAFEVDKVDDDQEESATQAKSSSQDTATTATVDVSGPQKYSSKVKQWPNTNNYKKGGHKYQRSGSNQSWSGDPQRNGDEQQRHQQQGKKGHTNTSKSKKKGKQQRDNVEASRDLTEEHFPALGGSSKKKTQHVYSKPKKAAYAEALLKPPVLTSVPSGEPTGQTRTNPKQHNVERQMKELCVSEQDASQRSSEQKASSS
jgi:hypothetical protein